ncbi:MAG: vitamin B12 dependent-methionine synthase activation domain-containing protein [Hyphomicrobiales bacterium]
METIGPIPVQLSLDRVQAKLRAPGPEPIEPLLSEALALAEAKAAFAVAYIEDKGTDEVVIEGCRFRSRVLRKNLETVGRVFPAVVTIGRRLEQKADQSTDLLEKYYLDMIGNLILAEARSHVVQQLCRRFAIETLSWMSPGSLEDWPLEAQRPLFALLNGVEASIGVQLTENLLMLPRKSVSGLFFPSQTTFLSCRLCPRPHCEARKARYDEKAVREYGLTT